MSTTTQDSMLEKVRALLERANHPNTPPAEAETALGLAQRLITKYNLDESALVDVKNDEDIVRDTIVVKGPYGLRRLSVAGAVARANSCACYRTRLHEKDWTRNRQGRLVRATDGYVLHIFGTKADIFATKMLWTAVEALALRTLPKGDKAFRNSWWIGFADGIGRALSKANKEAIVESTGNALVLVERSKRADSEMRAGVSLKSTRSAGVSRYSAYSSGQSTGASFSTNGVGRGAIGALGR